MPSIPQATSAEYREISDAEYEFAEATIARIRRAATDIRYRLAMFEAYALKGCADLIPGLIRAIDEYAANHTGEPVAA